MKSKTSSIAKEIGSDTKIGVVHDWLKDYDKARNYFQKALSVAEK